MLRSKSICSGCDHNWKNNDDKLSGGCRAYPKGIPVRIIGDLHSHYKPIKSVDDVLEWILKEHPLVKDYLEDFAEEVKQVGDYVYTPAKRERDIFGRKIEIF